MDKLFEQLKREVEEERRRLYAEKFDTPALDTEQSLLGEKSAK